MTTGNKSRGKSPDLEKLYEDPTLEDDQKDMNAKIEEKRMVDEALNQGNSETNPNATDAINTGQNSTDDNPDQDGK